MKIGDRLNFVNNLPITGYDSDGVDAEDIELQDESGFVQVLMHHDCKPSWRR